MKHAVLRYATLASALGTAGSATAVPVEVNIFGEVDFNQIRGGLTEVTRGAPVNLSFQVDSDAFVDSLNFPTRGYAIELDTFELTVGGISIGIVDPQPFGPALFVLRDNDPAVDGIFISRDVNGPRPIAVTIPGLQAVHELNLSRSFSIGTAFSSLDILDATGSFGTESIGSFNFSLGRFGGSGLESTVDGFTITAIPEPTSFAFFGLGCLTLLRRRHRGR